MGYLLAGGVRAVLMLAAHSFESGLVKRVSPLSFVTNPVTLFFTAMEVFPPIAWLYFVRNEQVVLGGAEALIGLHLFRDILVLHQEFPDFPLLKAIAQLCFLIRLVFWQADVRYFYAK